MTSEASFFIAGIVPFLMHSCGVEKPEESREDNPGIKKLPMQKSLLLAAATVAFMTSCQTTVEETGGYSHHIMSIDEVKDHFADPPPEYRPAPLWVWHTRITREEIDLQLSDFKKEGFGGTYIHPRPGLITEYLSGEWFELVEYTVRKGKELGLYIWIYDENSYPSGFAGGHVPARMPESYNQGVALKPVRQDVLQPSPDKDYELILMEENGQMKEITDHCEEYKGSKGQFVLFEKIYYQKSKWFAGFTYVDLLHKGVTGKFIEVTMNGYEESVGEEFGQTVPGVFTDEPNIGRGMRGEIIRWTTDLFKVFREKWGYDLKPRLMSLVEETGDWRKIRHNYRWVLLQMFVDRWSKPWHEYTEQKDLLWTGHYWEHGWPDPYHGGDNMAMYAWHQIPAIDMLFNTWEERTDQFGNARAVRELISVANQTGSHRTLSETYGGAGWEFGFEDMKRNGDWEYVLGVNFLNQHLSYMTLTGDRKHDYPQSFSYHEPWWEYYDVQADYFGRLSMALSSGNQENAILVLEPTTTAWMYYDPGDENIIIKKLGHDFEDFVDRLELNQIEYDLGSENIIKDRGKAEDGKFIVGEAEYELVVFPPGLENLDRATAKLIEEYLASGGKLLSFVEPPGYIDGGRDGTVAGLKKEYPAQYIDSEGDLGKADLLLLAPEGIIFDEPAGVGGLPFHQRRKLEDGQMLFLVNSDKHESAPGSLRIEGKDVLELDPVSGKIYSYPAEKRGDFMELQYDLSPVGSLLLFIPDKKEKACPRRPPEAEWEPLEPYTGMTVLPTGENVIALDYCFLTLDGREGEMMYFFEASDSIYKHHGFPDNPWASSIQYKTSIVDRDTFQAGTGFRADFPFETGPGADRSSMRLVVEQPELYEVSVNGTKTLPIPGEWWLDRQFGVFEIGALVREGSNMVTLEIHPMSVFAELAPVFITGEFNVLPVSQGFELREQELPETGSWKEQGWPFYHEGMIYSARYHIDKPGNRHKVKLRSWNGTVAAVRVNDEFAGVIGWNPYELEVSGLVKEGDNLISVEVIGSLKNLIGPHHHVTRRGIVTPWSWRTAPGVQPPGEEYDFLGYGLMEGFEVLYGK